MAARPFTRRQRLTLVATGLGLFMIFLDATIVNVALPDIADDFDVGESGLQWVVAAYSLTMGMFMMASASLADRRGRRRTYVGRHLVIFCIASAGVRLRPEPCRAQRRPRPPRRRRGHRERRLAGPRRSRLPRSRRQGQGHRASGPASPRVGLAIGPTVGGVLTESVGWRCGLPRQRRRRCGGRSPSPAPFVGESRGPRRPRLRLGRSGPVHRVDRPSHVRARRRPARPAGCHRSSSACLVGERSCGRGVRLVELRSAPTR